MIRPHRMVAPIRSNPRVQPSQQVKAVHTIPTKSKSAPVQMRFRTDGNHYADLKASGLTRDKYIAEWKPTDESLAAWDSTPAAVPGDSWRIIWSTSGDLLAGYAICCPRCKRVHYWTTANNCHWNEKEYTYSDGTKYKLCGHEVGPNYGSCWKWSGDPQQNKLTAQPSLWCTSDDCGWHGFLTDGILKEC